MVDTTEMSQDLELLNLKKEIENLNLHKNFLLTKV